MKNSRIPEDIGATFGSQMAARFNTVRTFFVTIASLNEDGTVNVYLFDDDKTFPVPTSLFGTEDYEITAIPAVGSVAAITYLDGDINRPMFVKLSEVDTIRVKRSNSTVSLTVDPDDDTKDVLQASVGESSIRMDKDVVEFNGGTLDGLVVVGKLTDRLNKLQSQINEVQQAIQQHSHTVATTGTAAAQTGNTTATVYKPVTFTAVKIGDYENKKVTQ